MKSSVKFYINRYLSKLFGVSLTSTSVHTRNIFNDLERLHVELNTVFDVGANQGQWSLDLLKYLSVSKIHCFEPLQSQFKILESSVAAYPQIKPWNLAVGDSISQSRIWLGNTETNSSLIKIYEGQQCELVNTVTLDEFCKSNHISHINLLKIDTEGYEMKVLSGANSLISGQQIDLIFTEVGFHSRYQTLTLFEQIRSFMEEMKYELFGIYDQQTAWNGHPYVVYGNACFISSRLIQNIT